jgi:TM2 domain-containing membrane protein YozV
MRVVAMSEKHYFVRVRGKIRGPFDVPQLRSMRDRGQFSSFHEVSEDRKLWMPATVVMEVFAPLARVTGPTAPPEPPTPANQWYYLAGDGQQRGPVSKRQLLFMRQDGTVSDSTLIWREGLSDWQPLGSPDQGLAPAPHDEFAAVVGAVRPPNGFGGGIDKMLWYDANKKSVFVAYLLWWFAGHFGAHRFYLGCQRSAVAMLICEIVALGFLIFGYSAFAMWMIAPRSPEIVPFALVCFFAAAFVLFAVGTWWFVDAFLIPDMTRNHNNRLIRRLG